MGEIKEACEQYMKYLRSDKYHEDGLSNFQNAIFEAAMEFTHGPDVWKEINERMK